MRHFITIVAILCSLVIPLAHADGQGACQSDIREFCSTAGGGKEKIMDCLIDHQKELTDACYDAVKKQYDRQQEKSACQADLQHYCQGMRPGDGKFGQCVHANFKSFSVDCQDVLKDKMQHTRSGQ